MGQSSASGAPGPKVCGYCHGVCAVQIERWLSSCGVELTRLPLPVPDELTGGAVKNFRGDSWLAPARLLRR